MRGVGGRFRCRPDDGRNRQLPARALPAAGDLVIRHRRGGTHLRAVLPTAALNAFAKALQLFGEEEATVSWDSRAVRFVSGNVAWAVSRLEVEYPDLTRFTGPLAGVRVEIDRDRLIEGVKQVSSIADDASRRNLCLTVETDRLHLFTAEQEFGEAQTVIPLEGEYPRRRVWLDARRLTSALRAQPQPEVALYVSEPLAPVAVAPADPSLSFRAILMPFVSRWPSPKRCDAVSRSRRSSKGGKALQLAWSDFLIELEGRQGNEAIVDLECKGAFLRFRSRLVAVDRQLSCDAEAARLFGVVPQHVTLSFSNGVRINLYMRHVRGLRHYGDGVTIRFLRRVECAEQYCLILHGTTVREGGVTRLPELAT